MLKYPYYIVVYFDSGVLKKLFHDTKFKSFTDAVNAMTFRVKRFPNFMKDNQVMILEYTMTYQGRITTIYNYGETVFVNNPINF